MQVYEKTGDIERGTISVSLSKVEIGHKNILFIMDYHRIGKNKYSISLFVQEKGNDMFYLCDNRDIEYRYSELEQFLKDLTFRSLKKKILHKFCNEYMAELSKMYEIKSINTGVMLIIHEEIRNNYTTINTVEINNICKSIKEEENYQYSISFDIDYKEGGEGGNWGTINCILSGHGKYVRDFLEQVRYNTPLQYDTETTYDENYTSIIIKFISDGKQEEVKLRLKNNNRYFTKKLEEYIAKRSNNSIYNNTYDTVMLEVIKRKEMISY